MSTSANVQVIDDNGQRVCFYRHDDGNPDSVLPDLHEFPCWAAAGRIRDNAIQAAGWLMLIGVRNYRGMLQEMAEDTLANLGPMPTKPYAPAEGDARNGYTWRVGDYQPSGGLVVGAEYRYTMHVADRTIAVLNERIGPPSVKWRVTDAGELEVVETIAATTVDGA